MDVSWIKITTDIFDDEKIYLIEQLPEHDSIIVIWFKLLALAGKSNNNGIFMLSNKIPYTAEMFAAIFRRPLNTVKLALETFENLGMIEIINNIVTLPNWEKHQNIKTLDDIREQTRKRVQKCRENQKKQIEHIKEENVENLHNCNATCNDCNATVTDKIREEEDKIREDKNLLLEQKQESCKKSKEKTKDEVKHKFGEFKNVLLKDSEYQKMITELGQEKTDAVIQFFSETKEMKGYVYKSDYLALKKWGIESYENQKNKKNSVNNYYDRRNIGKNECDRFSDEDLEKEIPF